MAPRIYGDIDRKPLLALKLTYTILVIPFSVMPVLEAAPFSIVDVRRHAVFAGRLGERVSEDLVVERDGTKILVHIAGSYHTLAVREGARLHVGDTVTIRGEDPAEGATVARDRIRKARS